MEHQVDSKDELNKGLYGLLEHPFIYSFFGRFPKHQTRLSRSPCVCLMCRINVGVIVTITPVGNQPPQFTANSYTIYVSEGEPVQSSLWRIPVRAIVSIS